MMKFEVNNILYATDLGGLGSSKNAFRSAVGLAQFSGAQIIVLHVIGKITSTVENMLRESMSAEEFREFKAKGIEHIKKDLKVRLDEFCAQECEGDQKSYPGGQPITVVEQGNADEVILNVANQFSADMIVMGTRTHSGIGQILLGSTANKVIHHSKVPVLVCPL